MVWQPAEDHVSCERGDPDLPSVPSMHLQCFFSFSFSGPCKKPFLLPSHMSVHSHSSLLISDCDSSSTAACTIQAGTTGLQTRREPRLLLLAASQTNHFNPAAKYIINCCCNVAPTPSKITRRCIQKSPFSVLVLPVSVGYLTQAGLSSQVLVAFSTKSPTTHGNNAEPCIRKKEVKIVSWLLLFASLPLLQ